MIAPQIGLGGEIGADERERLAPGSSASAIVPRTSGTARRRRRDRRARRQHRSRRTRISPRPSVISSAAGPAVPLEAAPEIGEDGRVDHLDRDHQCDAGRDPASRRGSSAASSRTFAGRLIWRKSRSIGGAGTLARIRWQKRRTRGRNHSLPEYPGVSMARAAAGLVSVRQGAVPVRSDTPYPFMYRYCSICRKTTGALTCNVMGKRATLAVTGAQASALPPRGHPPTREARRPESEGERWFCGACGSHLYVLDDRWPDGVWPNAAALDTRRCRARRRRSTSCCATSRRGCRAPGRGPRFPEYPELSIADWHARHGLGGRPRVRACARRPPPTRRRKPPTRRQTARASDEPRMSRLAGADSAISATPSVSSSRPASRSASATTSGCRSSARHRALCRSGPRRS